VIPASGKFSDLINELDFIIKTLGFRIIQLLPIHPTPTVYARMGRFGSPFAALDFMDVDPSLAEFDKKTTPLEQFRELVDQIHKRGAKIFLDIPVNHTGWASKLQVSHPEWFIRNPDHSFKSPGAWGVTWEDLAHLNYEKKELWHYMAEVFLFWCANGVDGFRCDAGYMIPLNAWQYITAKVKLEYPSTIFLLEGLGGKIEVVESLLANGGLDWAYSELFQNYTRGQIEGYLPACWDTSFKKGVLVNFSETHDNNRLASVSESYSRMRTAFTAMAAINGAFGITNGVEWFAKEKIDVHDASALNWGNELNQIEWIQRINAILAVHPCFYKGASVSMIQKGEGNFVVLKRVSYDKKSSLLIAVNLEGSKQTVMWMRDDFQMYNDRFYDLLSGKEIYLQQNEMALSLTLDGYEVVCCSSYENDLIEIQEYINTHFQQPAYMIRQLQKAKVIELYCYFRGIADISELNVEEMINKLLEDPVQFCRSLDMDGSIPPVVKWNWPVDIRRMVMVPPGSIIYIKIPFPFSVQLKVRDKIVKCEKSIPLTKGMHFILLVPPEGIAGITEVIMTINVFSSNEVYHEKASLLFLDRWDKSPIKFRFKKGEIEKDMYALCTNGTGAMAQVYAEWGNIRSQYDALLAANLHPSIPVDRQIMFTRCRAWLVYRGYSHEINGSCLEEFVVESNSSVLWIFNIPSGNGKYIRLLIRVRLLSKSNSIRMEFIRERMHGVPDGMEDGCQVHLILRPDVEDRNFHCKTKAYMGPEYAWRQAVTCRNNGFTFQPSSDHYLNISVTNGSFMFEPEWHYMVAHPLDAERGIDGYSDLFSPGYFDLRLRGGDRAELLADVIRQGESPEKREAVALDAVEELGATRRLDKALQNTMTSFLVRRDNSFTVIAGYPWFLDWGRDTLICIRGLIEAGRVAESKDIVIQFASRERNGTLPNMIRGEDDSNRDTSDAPLWLFVACEDILQKEHNLKFLENRCGGRTLLDVLISIASSYINGTPNGIKVDPETGLVFSPAHYTWMDTNFPAGTPREGYPIEIQALWYRALDFLSSVVKDDSRWGKLAVKVKQAINELYPLKDMNYLSDCLHCSYGCSARNAVVDDALRPNQLLAITLGAITDTNLCFNILLACEELLVPGAIRSLADRGVKYPIYIYKDNVLLKDPLHPYSGRYIGDEDASRKPSYHNGTAWTWIFPSYAEALYLTGGRKVVETALSLLSSSSYLINKSCIGHVPEIVDGDSPHHIRGCGAQAWGETELFRVISRLTKQI